jgi:hypothetical protein
VKQFARLNRANITSANGYQRNGMPTAIHELNVVSLATLVGMNDRANVTA